MRIQNRIHMIAEGPLKRKSDEIGRPSGKRSKLEEGKGRTGGAVISFGPYDEREVHAPHNDALVVATGVRGYDVRRILIDSGSAVDIVILACFRKMDLRMELKKAETNTL